MTPMTLSEAEAEYRAALTMNDETWIAAAGALLDRLDVHPPLPLLGASALWYAEQGLAVFPLQPAAKVPMRGSRGCKDATADPDRVRAWWEQRPDANIGLATGHLVDVIDIDGPAGVASWAAMLDALPPALGKVSTPRPGGTHLYVAAVPGRGNKARLLPGVDYRGTGGYVVAPPSVNADGVAYRWRAPLDLTGLGGEVAA